MKELGAIDLGQGVLAATPVPPAFAPTGAPTAAPTASPTVSPAGIPPTPSPSAGAASQQPAAATAPSAGGGDGGSSQQPAASPSQQPAGSGSGSGSGSATAAPDAAAPTDGAETAGDRCECMLLHVVVVVVVYSSAVEVFLLLLLLLLFPVPVSPPFPHLDYPPPPLAGLTWMSRGCSALANLYRRWCTDNLFAPSWCLELTSAPRSPIYPVFTPNTDSTAASDSDGVDWNMTAVFIAAPIGAVALLAGGFAFYKKSRV